MLTEQNDKITEDTSAPQQKTVSRSFGVALSGGGYRATAYHLGTLKRLNDLGLLSRIKVLSTISGGSISGAAYCLHKGDFASFEDKMVAAVNTKSVVLYGLTSWRLWLGLLITGLMAYAVFYLSSVAWYWGLLSAVTMLLLFQRYQFLILPIGKIIESAYNEFFFDYATLSGLCSQPELAIGSTNLQTKRQFTFSKRKMEDSYYANLSTKILFKGDNFPVARAVLASSCVPYAFTPVAIDAEYYADPAQYGKVDPRLIDGGVYDNQGVHKLTQENSSYRCDIVLVSDAGNKLPFEKSYHNSFTLLMRSVSIFMERIKNFQMVQHIYRPEEGKEVAYQSISWHLDNCVPGFYKNMVDGKVTRSTLAMHQLEEDWIRTPKDYRSEIIAKLEKNCNLAEIKKSDLDNDRLMAIHNIGTSLSKIPENLIRDMITHSANLTEVQLRLYCPSLFKIN